MTRFLYRVLKESGLYDPEVILLATSAWDSASVLAMRPSTWLRGPRVVSGFDRGMPFVHVGAWFSELEFQRYRSRRALSELLERFQIVQFVGGTAAWVAAAAGVRRPKFLWVATTIAGDTASRAGDGSRARRAWFLMMTRAAEWYEKRALSSADAVLALSPYTMHALQPTVSSSKLSLAFCGVDTSLFKPSSSRVEAAEENDGYILCVARLSDARKNVAMLLRAYASLSRQREHLPELWLVGEALSDHGERLVAQLGITERVHSLGPRHGEELAGLYRRASMFVLPSDEEGLGIVILEAMASGLPVVSTACGGPEVVVSEGKTGFLVPVGDEHAFAAAILRLVDDADLRRRLGQAGRRAVEERFSFRTTGGVFLEQYRGVARRHHLTTLFSGESS